MEFIANQKFAVTHVAPVEAKVYDYYDRGTFSTSVCDSWYVRMLVEDIECSLFYSPAGESATLALLGCDESTGGQSDDPICICGAGCRYVSEYRSKKLTLSFQAYAQSWKQLINASATLAITTTTVNCCINCSITVLMKLLSNPRIFANRTAVLQLTRFSPQFGLRCPAICWGYSLVLFQSRSLIYADSFICLISERVRVIVQKTITEDVNMVVPTLLLFSSPTRRRMRMRLYGVGTLASWVLGSVLVFRILLVASLTLFVLGIKKNKLWYML